MRSNQITKLLGALVILFAIAFFSGAFDEAPSTIDVPSIRVDTDNAVRIDVITPLHTVVVEKTAAGWKMLEPLEWTADETAISTFLNELKELKLKTVVAITPDRYERYGVDSTAYVIIVDDGAGRHELTMGPNGPDFSTVYMRVSGDERVFTASPRLSIPLSVARWRDKRMLSIPSGSVEGATIISPEESYSLSRDPSTGEWSLEQEGTTSVADSTKISRWLERFVLLRADGFVGDDTGSNAPTHSINFELADGSAFRIEAIEEERRFVLTMEPTDGAVYYLNSARAAPLFASSEGFNSSE